MGDAGAAMQRAQDKVAEMQARSGALDELLASGALTDLTSTNDDIQAQLDKAQGTSDIDAQLAALKSQVGTATSSQLPSGATPPAGDAAPSTEGQ
jgi:phage shock protein A